MVNLHRACSKENARPRRRTDKAFFALMPVARSVPEEATALLDPCSAALCQHDGLLANRLRFGQQHHTERLRLPLDTLGMAKSLALTLKE